MSMYQFKGGVSPSQKVVDKLLSLILLSAEWAVITWFSSDSQCSFWEFLNYG